MEEAISVSIEERILKLESEVRRLQVEINKIKEEINLHGRTRLIFPYSIYANIFRGLSHPTRILLLRLISEGGKYFKELLELTKLSPAALNFHIDILKAVGLVRQDAERAKYLITDLGIRFLDILAYLNAKLEEFETRELDLYCYKCGKAKMYADISPFYIRLWCPKCGGDHGDIWSLFLLNKFGADWIYKDPDSLVKECIEYSFEKTGESLRDSRCLNCSAKIKYKYLEDRIVGECDVCGFKISLQINDISLNRLAEYWIRYRRVKEILEGKVKHKGRDCWKVSLIDSEGRVKLTQYIEVGTGQVIDEETYE